MKNSVADSLIPLFYWLFYFDIVSTPYGLPIFQLQYFPFLIPTLPHIHKSVAAH
jgi:hypothetical protein